MRKQNVNANCRNIYYAGGREHFGENRQSASIKTSVYQSALNYLYNSKVIKEIKKSFMHISYRFHILFYNSKLARRAVGKNTRAAARPL